VGLLRFLAGLLLVLWVMRLLRATASRPRAGHDGPPPAAPKNGAASPSRFAEKNVEEADYEELP
jgi:hypothetical protein